MPKEYVYDEQFDREAVLLTRGEDGANVPHKEIITTTMAKVGWSKEAGHVSVALVEKHDPDGFEAQRHLNLDRAGINRMIAILRKARDDAFGKDQ